MVFSWVAPQVMEFETDHPGRLKNREAKYRLCRKAQPTTPYKPLVNFVIFSYFIVPVNSHL